MRKRIEESKFPFFSAVALLRLGTKNELNRLWKEKKIVIHEGINGKIIEFIKL